jgi:hypothetical protein
MDTAKPDDKVKGFGTLCCVEYQGPKTLYMFRNMNEEMKFDLLNHWVFQSAVAARKSKSVSFSLA